MGPVFEVVVLEAEAVVAALAGADRVAPLQGGALLAGEAPAEVDDLGDLGALGDDGGEERVVHPLLHDRHGNRAEPGDLAGLPVDGPPSEQGLEVDPDDDLGVGTGRHGRAVAAAGEELGGGVEGVGVGGFAAPVAAGVSEEALAAVATALSSRAMTSLGPERWRWPVPSGSVQVR